MALKLEKLPDRKPSKITFTAGPALKAGLEAYAKVYLERYGEKESVAELIPFMLDAFMKADPDFRRARKELERRQPPSPQTQERKE